MNDNDTLHLTLTEAAVRKIQERIGAAANPGLMLRPYWSADECWEFKFDDELREDDRLLEYEGSKVVVGSEVVDSLRDATLDWNEETDEFELRDAEIPDHATGCPHLAALPVMPDQEALKVMRKGLRKRNPPDAHDMYHGGHDHIGGFSFERRQDEILITWNLVGGPRKQATFDELCFEAERELDRLELGWMIANMALLDMKHRLEAAQNNIAHPIYCMNEMNRIRGYYEKIEERWRHWAIVPAGHMRV